MAAIKWVCLIAALLSATAVSAVSFGLRRSTCTSSWAVKVNGGLEKARLIAAKHGFEIREQVGNLRDVYHFSVGKYSMASMPLKAAAQYTSALKGDPNIDFAEQQCLRKRSKRQTPSDPSFNDQWYLLNTGQFGLNFTGQDHRIQRVWLQGVTGCNVTVAVVDDGVEYTHPDLQPNYDHTLDYDYVGGTGDAFPHSYFSERDSHGTSVAGIIAAAKDNGVCGAGGSYSSTITGVNILAQIEGAAMGSDMTEGGGLSHKNDLVDISSNSWGPLDYGFLANKPGPLASMALEMGAMEGRDGKGVIFTFAAGNGGSNDSCAADGYTNSIYTISVGAIGIDRKAASYDEVCSAKLVSAYVENHRDYLPKVTTTTVYAECSGYFDGTSAATPIISSIVALTLEANPNLTWRDVQYLLVYTSVSDHLVSENNEWRVNGAGLRYSHQFGFGVADAEAMVTRARHWINVPKQQMDSIQPEKTSGEFSDSISVTFTYDGDISFLEHLVVTTTLNLTSDVHSDDDIMEAFELVLKILVSEDRLTNASELLLKRGDIQIELLSPSGSKSILLPYRDNDIVPYASFPSTLPAEILEYISLDYFLPDGYIDWPFMSVHYWGEDPRGEWTLTFRYRGVNDLVTFEGLNVTLYGTVETPEAIMNYTECNSMCVGGCARAGSSVFCHSCSNLRHAETLECIDVCPTGYQDLNGYCYNSSKPEPVCVKSLETPPGGSCIEAGYGSCCSSGECAGSVRSCYCDEECHIIGDCCQDIVSTCGHKNVTITFLDIQNTTAGVIERGSVPMGDTVLVGVDVPGRFPFGHEFFTRLYVLEDGYISFGEFDTAAVLPFWTDADTTTSGAVNYITVNGGPLLTQLNSFITARQNVHFEGTWALIVEWKNILEYFSIDNTTNTFQGALIMDGHQSYTLFIYKCGLLTYGVPKDTGIGVYSENATLVNLNRIVNIFNFADKLACANLPNEWNTLVYALTETIDTVVCTSNVENPPYKALLNCSGPPAGIVNVTCFLPGSPLPFKINCDDFPAVINTVQFPLGESIIQVVGYAADTGEEVLLGRTSVVIPEIDVRFTNDTPLVVVGSVYAQFEINRNDADIDCIVTGFARSKCSAGTYSLSSVPAGRKVLKVIVKDVVRKERKVVRIGLPLPENDDVCYTHLINRGWRVDGDRFTVEFTSTGNAQGYTCVLDRMYELDKCSSPLVFPGLQPGHHHVRIVPQGCRKGYKVWSQRFDVK